MAVKLFANCCFVAFCLIGCSWQVYNLARHYFMYTVNTDIFLEIPKNINPPAISICYRYIDILDKNRLLRERNITIDVSTVDKLFFSESLLTIAEIFEYSP